MTRVGTLDAGRGSRRTGAVVDDRGVVAPDGFGWSLDWRIGADDRWRIPQHETAVRQSLVEHAPVVRTAMRVPGGDAVSQVYGSAEAGGIVVVEVANESPAPFVVAFVVRGASSVALDGATVIVDRHARLVLPRVPSRWAVARGAGTDVEVCGGTAREGPFAPVRDRAGRIEAAFLLPVPHRVSLRAAIATASPAEVIDLGRLAPADDVARGWRAQADRGMRVDLPDDRLTSAITAARAQLVLAAQRSRPSGLVLAALEDWGFDDEFDEAWRRAGARERRRAAARPSRPPRVDELDALARAAQAPFGMASVAPELLLCARGMLAWESPRGDVVLLAEHPESWRGAPLEVRDAPTHGGPLSYAVRWHGPRPALLWSGPAGLHLSAPSLDQEWSSDAAEGEVLLSGAAA